MTAPLTTTDDLTLEQALAHWKHVRLIADEVNVALKEWEFKVKQLAQQRREATPLEKRGSSIITAGVQVRHDLEVEYEDSLGDAVGMMMTDVLKYSKLLTLTPEGMMTLVGLIYAGKYPELNTSLTIDAKAYQAWVKEQLDKRMKKKGMSLDQAQADLNAPVDSVTLKETYAITLQQLTAVEPAEPASLPFAFTLRPRPDGVPF